MASPAQVLANRANAKKSTGPKTAAGKLASSANATQFGLFSKNNCVEPEDHEEFETLRDALLTQLHPVGALEEMHAADIVRATWRIQRCAAAEESLCSSNRRQETRAATFQERAPYQTADTLCYPATAPIQEAVDRARAHALSIRRRALADLEKLQNERFLRAELLGGDILNEAADLTQYGVAGVKHVFSSFLQIEANSRKSRGAAAEDAMAQRLLRLGALRPGILQNEPNRPETDRPVEEPQAAPHASTNRTQSDPPPSPAAATPQTPRNAPCPCKSGEKYKRCCGQNAPPVLHGSLSPLPSR